MPQTRVRPDAFAQATVVRRIGIGVTGLLSVLSGAMLAALLMIISLAIGMADRVGPFLPGLAGALVLAGYVALAPPVFASWTRGTTAGSTGGWLAAAVAGYAVLWTALLSLL